MGAVLFTLLFIGFLSFMGGLIVFLRWHERTYPDTSKVIKRR